MLRAAISGTYFNSLTAASTFSLVSGLNVRVLLSTQETVAMLTPARSATNARLGLLDLSIVFSIFYPLMPLSVTPSINNFWKQKNSTAQGISMMIPPAICTFASGLFAPLIIKSMYRPSEMV